jgi:hypothetical protein
MRHGRYKGANELEIPLYYMLLAHIVVNTILLFLLFAFNGFDPIMLALFLPQFTCGLGAFELGRKILFVMHGWLAILLSGIWWTCLTKQESV